MRYMFGGDAAVSVSAVETWSGVFGGRHTDVHFSVRAEEPFRGRVGWSLAVGRQTIARGETAVSAGPQEVGSVEVRLDVPEAKQGAVVPADLTLAVYARNQSTPGASLEKRLWDFPENPLAHRSQWLERLQIQLFDPVEQTRQVFEKMEVPFSETPNLDFLSVLDQGLLVIGEGTSLEDYPSLSKVMVKAAARGVPVLCLAPSAGQMVVPGSEGAGLPVPTALSLRRSDVIRDLDKRLDWLAWPPEGNPVASSLVLKGDRGRLIGQVANANSGWSWLEADFGANRKKLVVCGFGVVQHWEAGPTPRFLLARILDYISADDSTSTDKGDTQ